MDKLYLDLQEIVGKPRVKADEPMSSHTSMQTGGAADIYLRPDSEDSLIAAVDLLAAQQVPYYIVGNGTNVIVKDGGFRGAIIEVGKGMDGVIIDTHRAMMTAGAGASLSAVAKRAANAGLSGFERISGIPGTVGGALFMNAGAYDGEMSQVVTRANVYDCVAQKIVTMNIYEMRLGYRYSIFQTDRRYIILSVSFGLKHGDTATIKSKFRRYARWRNAKQPMDMPSVGSFFKRPEGAYAGALIDEAGLKGVSIGGAQVSEKHAGFIVNTGGATAADVISLMDKIQDEVKRNSGYELEPEPRFIGE